MSNPVKRLFLKVKDEVEFQYHDKTVEWIHLPKIEKEEAIEYYKTLDDETLKFAYTKTKSKRDLKIITNTLKARGYRYSKAFSQFIK